MDWIFDAISLVLWLIVISRIEYSIYKIKRENEKKDQQIQHLWTKIDKLEEKIEKLNKNTPE